MTTVLFSVVGLMLAFFMVWVADIAYTASTDHRERTPNPAACRYMLSVGLLVTVMFQGLVLIGAFASGSTAWPLPLALMLGACVAMLAHLVGDMRHKH